jgi:hypothetical protein
MDEFDNDVDRWRASREDMTAAFSKPGFKFMLLIWLS